MKLQTIIPLSPSARPIDYHSKILLLGSCFAEHLGGKLNYFKFQQLLNPQGILFHPLAIVQFLERVLNKKEFTEDDLIYYQERWHCFEAHSSKSKKEAAAVLYELNKNLKHTYDYLKEASHLFITLGTAWAYRYNETGKLVANCHKIPQPAFSKELIENLRIVDHFKPLLKQLIAFNPDLQIVFTISPVRHLKDGFVENQLSKAQLISAVHKLIQQEKSLAYFPSYELMMDELRDYRFYKKDMLHPNEIAIDYIWEKFIEVYVSSDARNDLKTIEDIQNGLNHRPFNPNSDAHRTFLQKLEHKQLSLTKRFPHIKFDR